MRFSIEQDAKAFRLWTILTGAAMGLAAVALARLGNPPNMGLCSACFLRDVAGGLHLFPGPAALQYLRPEVSGFILGSFGTALAFREFRPLGGSSAVLRFLLGAMVMIGALIFLGCPIRLMLRLGGGDFATALFGLAGLAAGAAAGALFIARGYTLGSARGRPIAAGLIAPVFGVLIIALAPLSVLGSTADDGPAAAPAALHAPLLVALGLGVLMGVLGQRSRFCMAGGFRDAALGSGWRLLLGYAALLAAAVAGNLVVDAIWPGARPQFQWGAARAAHAAHLWNFLAMFLVGIGSILLGGCPFRQLVAAGQGSLDATMALLGLLFGAALCHNLNLLAKPDLPGASGGPTTGGMIAVVAGIVFCLLVGLRRR